MTDEKSTAVKVIALTAASLALLSACGEPKATPMDDEYAGNSGESVESQEDKSKTDGKATDNSSNDDDSVKNHADDSNSTKSDKTPAIMPMAPIRLTANTVRSAKTPSMCI